MRRPGQPTRFRPPAFHTWRDLAVIRLSLPEAADVSGQT